jgi:hypothetical protein
LRWRSVQTDRVFSNQATTEKALDSPERKHEDENWKLAKRGTQNSQDIMADQETIDEIETGELIAQVDDGRAANDPFKLTAGLRTLTNTRLAEAKARYSASLLSGGDEVAAAERVREAVDKLRSALRNGYNYIKGVPEEDLPAAARLGTFESYGWEGGIIGDLTSVSRLEVLAEQAAASSAIVEAARYPAPSARASPTGMLCWKAIA